MIYVALVVAIIMLGAAGVLAWKNSQIIAGKRTSNGPDATSLQYTVHMTNQWQEQDAVTLVALFHTSYVVGEQHMNAYLCRVTGKRGELKLYEAENVLLHNIRNAKQKGTLLSGVAMHELVVHEEEKEVLNRLEKVLTKSENG
ncbi:hypothetical protein [Paenibacillus antarcticus]|uniref:Uncharacterized protein n=1 Tax=Paenibacillus antarcticus TaxID=253703 RepID=A0A168MY95_9BACL|nr:hypothetical protein [Paenibacillus antarcticus]OAB45185.1 hypothetical protein PBAT_14710 [Paenibacillus antarcticus]